MKYTVLYNPLSGSAKNMDTEGVFKSKYPDDELSFNDITKIEGYKEFFDGLADDETIIICGGDGTLSRFASDAYGLFDGREILYYATGTGNDFLKDLGCSPEEMPVKVDQYLKDLPLVTVKGKSYRFINNVGFGIDGYCCEVGDDLRNQGVEKVNYTSIAIKGLLGKFKPVTAKVTVDGKTKTYNKAWLAPTMKGRFYGGGMMPAPDQDRNDPDKFVSAVVMYGKGKLKTLIVFPSIFKGEHIKHTEMCEAIKGHSVKVEFDRPCAVQIDGETIKDVTSYEVIVE